MTKNPASCKLAGIAKKICKRIWNGLRTLVIRIEHFSLFWFRFVFLLWQINDYIIMDMFTTSIVVSCKYLTVFATDSKHHVSSGRRLMVPSRFASKTLRILSGAISENTHICIFIVVVNMFRTKTRQAACESKIHSLYHMIKTNYTAVPCRQCKYGGEDEYFIEVRETGNHTLETIKSTVRREITEARLNAAMWPL